MSTVKQGRVGEALVVTQLVQLGYDVYLPAFGNAEFDMVAAKEGKILRVEVKSTTAKTTSGKYQVQLKSVRPNKTKNVIKKFDGTKSDILAICVIPTGRVHLLNSMDYNETGATTVEG